MEKYLNLDQVRRQESSAGKFILWGFIGICAFALGILCCFFPIAGEKVSMKLLPVYIILMASCAIPIYIGKKKKGETAAARRYEKIFGNDVDGTVTAEELSSKTGKPSFKIFSELEVLFRKGYFQNCNLQLGGNPCVKINNALDDDTLGAGFVEVKCPNCGGTSRIRAGTYGKCSYCGESLFGAVQNAGK